MRVRDFWRRRGSPLHKVLGPISWLHSHTAMMLLWLYVYVLLLSAFLEQSDSLLVTQTLQRFAAYNNAALKHPSVVTKARPTHPHTRSCALEAARSGGGGSTKIDTRIKQDTATKSTFREEIEKDWRLILHDDTVHTIQQVVEILGATCPLCAGAKAYEVTLEVHMSGAGTVAISNKKVIGEYCKSLQMAGLSVSMAPDEDFESGEGEE